MKEQIELVFALHEQDMQVLALRRRLEKIQPELAELESSVSARQASLNEKTAKMAEWEALKRSKEREVETSEARLKEFQGKLSQIKTNKEYQAALKEMADTKKNNKALEDQILELMGQIDALKPEVQGLQEEVQTALSGLEKHRQDLEAEALRLNKEMETIDAEKGKISARIESGIMAQYQRVKKNRSEAVSEVVGGTCQACRMKIPPQLYIEIQKFKAIHTCPSCQRILYLSEWIAKPTAAPDPRVDRPDGMDV